VLLALTGYQAALVAVAACFIVFALVAALVVPRTWPSFPGNRLGVFLAVCGVLFVAQITAVLALADRGEADEPAHEQTTGAQPTTPTETQTTETQTTETTAAQGDATAGKAVFTGAGGCGACHTLSDANATGQIGPDLDLLKPTYDMVVNQVTNGGGGMPPFKGTLTEQQIQDVAAYVSSVTQG
jgi:mono/diheme cytochrome c family protein